MKREKTKQDLLRILLKKIPRGRVSTYKVIARKLGIHPRYAGYLLGKNDSPEKYPCYKIVRANGTIGGYALGTAKKKLLLRQDGIKITDDRVADFPSRVYYFR